MTARILPLLLAPLLAGPAAAAERIVDRIAAVVNDDVITLSQVYEASNGFIEENCAGKSASCMPELEREVLDALVRRSLQRQELIRLDLDITPSDVDASIRQILVEYDLPDRETLRREVQRGGLSWEDYRAELGEQLRDQRFQEYVLRSRVTIRDEEVRDAYQRAVRNLDAPEVVGLSAFGFVLPADLPPDQLVGLVEEFRGVFATVRAGERTFESLVDEYDSAGVSELFSSQTFGREDLAEPLAAAAWKTEVGGLADPVVSRGVLYGLRVDRREAGEVDVPELDAVRDQLMQELFQAKMEQAEAEWYQVARRRAAIRVLIAGAEPTPPEDDPDDGAETPDPEPAPADAPVDGGADDTGP